MERRIAVVTGSNGFVGRGVCARLQEAGWHVRHVVRSRHSAERGDAEVVEVGDIARSDWTHVLEGVDAVLHLAAHVHRADAGASAYQRVNTEATLRLARAASRAGVRRFVYLSTVKVMGETTTNGRLFTEVDSPRPSDAYARSKFEAELGLREFAGTMEMVVIRPPLVYGPGVGANFLRLMEWVDRGIWLPFGSVTNRRSLIYIGNLASAIVACLRHPSAGGLTFLVSDGEDLSTPDLIRRIGVALGKVPRCYPVPYSALSFVAAAFGRGEEARRLLGSLQIDSALIRDRLQWVPPHSVDQGLEATAAWFRGLKGATHARGAGA